MEPYLLTQEDINKILAAGGTKAMPGEVATAQDLQLLGITPQPMPEATAGGTRSDITRASRK
jgi:hypothetical protein